MLHTLTTDPASVIYTMDGSLNTSSKIEKTDLSKNLASQDNIINNVGNVLLNMCKSNSMLLLNGRCGELNDLQKPICF